jgi:ribosomal protein L7/L12
MGQDMDYTDLSSEQQEELLVAGTNMMRTVTEIWGADKGMELWDSIATTVGQDFKGAVFFAMLTGQCQGDVVLSKVNEQKYVECIKAIRGATGMGLKEAKDTCDVVRYQNQAVKIQVSKDVRVRKFKIRWRVEITSSNSDDSLTQWHRINCARVTARKWVRENFVGRPREYDYNKWSGFVPNSRDKAYIYFISEEDVSHFLLSFKLPKELS